MMFAGFPPFPQGHNIFVALYLWTRSVIVYFLGQSWVRFGIVGVAATLVYFVLAVAFERYGVPIFVGNTLSYVLGFGVSYTGHCFWTFKSKASHGSALPKFLLTQLFGLGLNTAIIWVLMRLGLAYIVAMPVAIVTVPVVVYLISKFWVFRDPAAYVPKVPPMPPVPPVSPVSTAAGDPADAAPPPASAPSREVE